MEEADLENEIGRRTVPEKAKIISEEDADELCAFFSALQTKTSSFPDLPPALRGSIISEKPCTEGELLDMCTTWVNVEEREEILNEEVEEALQ